MTQTLRLPVGASSITRTGRIGRIISQLREISHPKSRVAYNNSTREFVIQAPTLAFCEKTSQAIEAAMTKLAREMREQRANPQQQQQQQRPDTRSTAFYSVPAAATEEHRLALQKKFGAIGRFIKNGCYFQLEEHSGAFRVAVKAKESRSIQLALNRLQEAMTSILHPKSRAPKGTTKRAGGDTKTATTGRFDAFLEVEKAKAVAQKKMVVADESEKTKAMETLTQWAHGAGLGRGRAARDVGRSLHEARTALAEEQGVHPATINDREANRYLRNATAPAAPTVPAVPANTDSGMLMMTPIPVPVRSSSKSTNWAKVAAAPAPEPVKSVKSRTKVSAPKLTFAMPTTTLDWADDGDEDITGSWGGPSAFEGADAIASSA